jgi:predicted nucleic acid-binding protein
LILVDTNILLDVITTDAIWYEWSVEQLDRERRSGALVINDLVFAEVATRYRDASEVSQLLNDMGLVHVAMSREALFLAVSAFGRYRKAGGTRTGVLPDFFIGAHAVAAGIPLLTRDRRRYETYFPTATLIAP